MTYINSSNQARQIDRDQFVYGYQGLGHGNHAVTIVTVEPTGTTNVQRVGGLFTSTIFGGGLGDLDFDGDRDLTDKNLMQSIVAGGNTQFNAAADFNGDGLIDATDQQIFLEDFIDQLRGPIDFGDGPVSAIRPYFTDLTAPVESFISLESPGNDALDFDAFDLDLNELSRDDSANDSIYLRFTATADFLGTGDTIGEIAGLELSNAGDPTLTIGNRLDSEFWSYFTGESGSGPEGDLNSSFADGPGSEEYVYEGLSKTFLAKIQYRAGLDDEITIWMDPLDALDNGQLGSSTTFFTADASFDNIRFVAGTDLDPSEWTFEEIHIGKQLKPGPAHVIDGGLHLGAAVDAEGGVQATDDATGDDNNGVDDEDGVTWTRAVNPGFDWTFEIEASADGLLDGWIDFNGDGVLQHPTEHINSGGSVLVVAGSQTVSVATPFDAIEDDVLARFRISSTGELLPDDYAIDGEVEDYFVTIETQLLAIDDVFIDSTDWNPAFRSYFDAQTGLGYSPDASGSQLTTIPWMGVDTISVRFTTPLMTPIDESAFHLNGVNASEQSFTLSYDETDFVVTLEFAAPLTHEKWLLTIDDTLTDSFGTPIDGEWQTDWGNERSGNDVPGGRFEYRFNTLEGDGDASGFVGASDFQVVGPVFATQPIHPSYNARADMTGDAYVLASDFQVVGRNFAHSLPAGEPQPPSTPPPAPFATGIPGNNARAADEFFNDLASEQSEREASELAKREFAERSDAERQSEFATEQRADQRLRDQMIADEREADARSLQEDPQSTVRGDDTELLKLALRSDQQRLSKGDV